MKKFSKLITESKPSYKQIEGLNKMSPLMNPTDWEDVFKPLIDLITGDLKTNNQGPGDSVFSNETLADLKRLMTNVNKDYKEYWQYVVHDGSQESFLEGFKINVKHEEIFDCIQPLVDNVNDVGDYADFDTGCFVVDLVDPTYSGYDEFFQDLTETHSKLQMLDCDFTIGILPASNSPVSNLVDIITKNHNPKFSRLKDLENKERYLKNIESIMILIYNKDTVQTDPLSFDFRDIQSRQ